MLDNPLTVEPAASSPAHESPPATAAAEPLTAGVVEGVASATRGDFVPLIELLRDFLLPGIGALLGVLVSYFVARFLARCVSGPVCRRVDLTLGKFAGKFVFYSTFIGAAVAIAGAVGLNVTSFAALFAAAGFAIGMAFQGTLGNFSAGILLLVFRPFKVGDLINAAGVIGKVNEIDLFTTTVDTPDNRRLILPNSAVAGGTIENVTHHPERRVEVRVGVSYTANIDTTRKALTTAAQSLAEITVQGENRGFVVLLDLLGNSSVEWMVRLWAPTPRFFEAKERLTAAIKENLDRAGITIPFPQLDVHLDGLQLPQQLTASEDQGLLKLRPRLRYRS